MLSSAKNITPTFTNYAAFIEYLHERHMEIQIVLRQINILKSRVIKQDSVFKGKIKSVGNCLFAIRKFYIDYEVALRNLF